MERISFSMKLQGSKLKETWEKWKSYISLKRALFCLNLLVFLFAYFLMDFLALKTKGTRCSLVRVL